MWNVTLTRRDFLKVAGAGAAGMTLLGTAGCSQPRPAARRIPSEGRVQDERRRGDLDSLRKDHVGAYGNDWIRPRAWTRWPRRACASRGPTPSRSDHLRAARDPHGLQDLPFQGLARKGRGRRAGSGAGSPSPREQTHAGGDPEARGLPDLFVTDTLTSSSLLRLPPRLRRLPLHQGPGEGLYRPRTAASSEKIDEALSGVLARTPRTSC